MPTAALPMVDAADIRSLVGPAAFERAKPYARNGAVFALDWDGGNAHLTGSVHGTGPQPYRCSIRLAPGKVGYWRPVAGTCSCPVRQDCKHIAATLLASNADAARGRVAATAPAAAAAAQPQTTPPAAWKVALGLSGPSATRSSIASSAGTPSFNASGIATAPLALQFELRETAHRSRGRWQRTSTITVAASPGETQDLLVAVRPVVRSKSGRWVTSNVGWGSLHYQVNRLNLDERQVRWFGQFSAVSRSAHGVYLGQDPDRIILNDYASPLLWNLLDEASTLGIALVSTKNDGAVHVAQRATVALDASSAENNEHDEHDEHDVRPTPPGAENGSGTATAPATATGARISRCAPSSPSTGCAQSRAPSARSATTVSTPWIGCQDRP